MIQLGFLSLNLKENFSAQTQDTLLKLRFYLHWGELVLVVLGESRGCAIFQQCIVVQQHTDIVKDLDVGEFQEPLVE